MATVTRAPVGGASTPLGGNAADTHTTNALRLLTERHAARQRIFEGPDDGGLTTESDSDVESECPIVDQFIFEGGQEAILQLCGFTLEELREVYEIIKDTAENSWSSGRGRRSKCSPFDTFFMTCVTMKHGGTWDFLARMFRLKGPTFQRMVCKALVFRLQQMVLFKWFTIMECMKFHLYTLMN